jgi:hypothetical protein
LKVAKSLWCICTEHQGMDEQLNGLLILESVA